MARCENSSQGKDNFAYGFRLIYYFARACGQMPFTITYHANGAIDGAKIYKRDIIWLVISIGLQIAFILLIIHYLTSFRNPNADTSTLYLANLFAWFMTVLIGIVMIALDLCNRSKIVGILKKFTHFDKEVFSEF